MDLLTYGFSEAVALLLITGALLHLTRRRPTATRSTTTAWANLLLGIALALFPLSRLPDGHRLLWDDVLIPPALLCLLVSSCLHWRGRRAERA